jgi:nitrogen regulatory protein PII
MKKIEPFITTEKTDSTLSALDAIGIQATFYESKDMGKGEKYKLSYGRGVAGTTKMPYSERLTLVTIVEENQVKEILDIIRASAITSQKGAGGIIVIFTGRRNSEYLISTHIILHRLNNY